MQQLFMLEVSQSGNQLTVASAGLPKLHGRNPLIMHTIIVICMHLNLSAPLFIPAAMEVFTNPPMAQLHSHSCQIHCKLHRYTGWKERLKTATCIFMVHRTMAPVCLTPLPILTCRCTDQMAGRAGLIIPIQIMFTMNFMRAD